MSVFVFRIMHKCVQLERVEQYSPLEITPCGSCDNFAECAELCVNKTPKNLALNRRFRGFDYNCNRRSCRCLYDAGSFTNNNTSRFDRVNSRKAGTGAISDSKRKTANYCGKLVNVKSVQEVIAEQ